MFKFKWRASHLEDSRYEDGVGVGETEEGGISLRLQVADSALGCGVEWHST